MCGLLLMIALSAGGWHVTTDISPMDDSKTVILTLESEGPVRNLAGLPEKATLIVRCLEGQVTAYINTGSSSFEGETDVTLRFDGGEPTRYTWSNSTTGQALFPPDPKLLIGHLLAHERLLFRWLGHSAGLQTVSFEIQGLGEVIPQISKACNWEPVRRTHIPALIRAAELMRDKINLFTSVEMGEGELIVEGVFGTLFILEKFLEEVAHITPKGWAVQVELGWHDLYPEKKLKVEADQAIGKTDLGAVLVFVKSDQPHPTIAARFRKK